MALQINIVFHKTLHREAYDLPKPIIEKYFRFIAVNDKIEKSIPEDLAALVLKETSIKNSSGALQELGMRENSVLFHFYLIVWCAYMFVSLKVLHLCSSLLRLRNGVWEQWISTRLVVRCFICPEKNHP